MKKVYIYISIIVFTCLFFICLPAQAAQHLDLSYPKKINRINSPNTYFIGNTNPGSNLTINNQPVSTTKEGLFLKILPLSYGTNIFKLKSTKNNLTAEKNVTIMVPFPEKPLPEKPLQIAMNTVNPGQNAIYSSGDIINVRFKASPGARASFSIGNKTISMTELPPQIDTVKMMVLGEIYGNFPKPVPGYYNGVYQVQTTDKFQQAPLKIHLSDGKGDCKSVLAQAKITTWTPDDIPRVVEITKEDATTRTGPGDSRLTPLDKGIKLHVVGYEKGYYRYEMGPLNEGYIPASLVKMLPKGTPIPHSEVRSIDVKKTAEATYVNIPLTTKLPYQVEQAVDQSTLTLFLYGAKADTEIIKYDYNDPYIYQLKWYQPYKNVFKLDCMFKKHQQWGYEVYYTGFESKGTLTLVLKIKSPPKVNEQMPLKDRVIAIDPGHGGWEKGSLGFALIPEKQINLEISNKIAKMLESEGAKVVLTRTNDSYVGIYDRPDMAAKNNADLLLSIHNNAIPDGRDPMIEHGSSTYYYHPMAFPLAESVHNEMLKQLKTPDFGLYYDNLALPREYRMPSILVEIAFMINPAEYVKLTDSDFQQSAARAIVDGIKNFFIATK